MTQWVYAFGDGKAEGDAGLKNLLGGKGANLAEMSNLGLPVPPGSPLPPRSAPTITITAEPIRRTLKAQVDAALDHVGQLTGRTFGDAQNPLLVSVRSGARASMPGMMDTVLNLGLNDVTVEALARARAMSGSPMTAIAASSQMYSNVVLGHRASSFRREPRTTTRTGAVIPSIPTSTADDWKALIPRYKAIVEKHLGKPFPAGPA